jgi:peptidyl-prolyl cis-trans isomerase C
MRNFGWPAAVVLAALAGAAQAQTTNAPAAAPAQAPAQAEAPAGTGAAADPVVAKVGDAEIHASDVREAMAQLPEQYRQLPPSMLFPMLLDQMIDRKALLLLAEKQGLDKDPAVARQMSRAADGALQNALLGRVITPQITDDKIKARYDATIAGKPGEEEVHAKHILVADEATAKKIIEQLKGGADFAELAKKNSTDPGAANGGDLGWFKKGDMVPEFSSAAFALQPGKFTETPIHSQYGWHVILLVEKRQAPPPTLDESRDQLRQGIIQEAIHKEVDEAKQGLTIQKFNADGSAPKPTDSVEPPAPAPAK